MAYKFSRKAVVLDGETLRPEKDPAKKQRLGMNTVQFPFGLFCPFQAELMKQLS